jgi:LacI family transcriptional regulator
VSVADTQVAAALKFIRAHACEGANVGDVLRAVPMSRTLLEKKFQALLGHSPHRQIVQTKIERAKHLLVESEVSIAVVAELAGFDSASYLSVAFRRETGESPYAYRAHRAAGGGRSGKLAGTTER